MIDFRKARGATVSLQEIRDAALDAAKKFKLESQAIVEQPQSPEELEKLSVVYGISSRKIGARKCTVSTIDAPTARQFLDANHLSGFVPAAKHLGLWLGSELVAVLSYGTSRFKRGETEIHRFAVLKNVLL